MFVCLILVVKRRHTRQPPQSQSFLHKNTRQPQHSQSLSHNIKFQLQHISHKSFAFPPTQEGQEEDHSSPSRSVESPSLLIYEETLLPYSPTLTKGSGLLTQQVEHSSPSMSNNSARVLNKSSFLTDSSAGRNAHLSPGRSKKKDIPSLQKAISSAHRQEGGEKRALVPRQILLKRISLLFRKPSVRHTDNSARRKEHWSPGRPY